MAAPLRGDGVDVFGAVGWDFGIFRRRVGGEVVGSCFQVFPPLVNMVVKSGLLLEGVLGIPCFPGVGGVVSDASEGCNEETLENTYGHCVSQHEVVVAFIGMPFVFFVEISLDARAFGNSHVPASFH